MSQDTTAHKYTHTYIPLCVSYVHMHTHAHLHLSSHTHTHTHTHITQDIDGGLNMEVGPTFYPGSRGEEEGRNSDHDNPDSFPWCLMNLCITKMVQEAVRKVLSTAGLEVLGEQMAAVLSCVLKMYDSCPVLCANYKDTDIWQLTYTSMQLCVTPPPSSSFIYLCRAGDCFPRPLFCTESDG